MTRTIKCIDCDRTWNSNAKTLQARGVYCRNCKGTNLSWFSEYTGANIEQSVDTWENKDFLSQEKSIKKSQTLPDIQTATITKSPEEEQLTKEEIRQQTFVTNAEKLVTKTGKKFSLRSTDNMIATGLKMFEDFQNTRFETSGYNFRYGEGGNEQVREEMIDAFQDAYGVTSAISPELAFWLLFGTYMLPSGYHEARYKSLGVKVKTWFVKFKAQRQQKAEEKKTQKRKGREELKAEVEELEQYAK